MFTVGVVRVGSAFFFVKQPFVGDGYERVGLSVVLRAALCTWINTVRYAPPSVITFR